MAQIFGSSGSDFIVGTPEADWISGRQGNDTILAGGGNDTINMSTAGTSSHGNDSIGGGAGVDTLDYGSAARSAISVDLAAGTASSSAGTATLSAIENVNGSTFGDRPLEELPRDNYMAAIARKRRPVWPDRDTVRTSYSSRAPLDVLAPEFLDAYLQWGFVDRADGSVELACTPEDEATVFEVAGARTSVWYTPS